MNPEYIFFKCSAVGLIFFLNNSELGPCSILCNQQFRLCHPRDAKQQTEHLLINSSKVSGDLWLLCYTSSERKQTFRTSKSSPCSAYSSKSSNMVRSPWDIEVCVLLYRACDMWLAGWRVDFAILCLAQSLALVPNGIDANDWQCVKPNGNRKWIPYPYWVL
jgi:hypothetical protein